MTKYNKCPTCGRNKALDSKNCLSCYQKKYTTPFTRKAIIESFSKLFEEKIQ